MCRLIPAECGEASLMIRFCPKWKRFPRKITGSPLPEIKIREPTVYHGLMHKWETVQNSAYKHMFSS